MATLASRLFYKRPEARSHTDAGSTRPCPCPVDTRAGLQGHTSRGTLCQEESGTECRRCPLRRDRTLISEATAWQGAPSPAPCQVDKWFM